MIKLTEATGRTDFVLAVRPDTELSKPLIEAMCVKNGPVTCFIKHLPETVNGDLSSNVLESYCATLKP